MGLKMKWSVKILLAFVALSAVADNVFAQNPPPPAAPAADSSVAIPPAPGTQTIDQPAQPVPSAGTPAPVYVEPLTWSTAALRAEIVKSVEASAKKEKTKKKKLSEAKVKTYRSKMAKNDKDMKSRVRLAEHFEAIGSPDDVIDVLRPAMTKLDRDGVLALARAYHEKKDYAQEIRILETQVARTPKDYVVQHAAGEAYSAMKKQDQAFQYFSEARRLNANYMPAYESLLRSYKKEGHYHDAVTVAQDMQQVFGDTPEILNELCLLYAHGAFLEKSVETCKLAIQKSPKYARNHVVLGLALKEKDGNSAAAKILQGAAKQFTKSEFAQYAAGELNWERKNAIDALMYFEYAVKADPRSARSQLGLGRVAFEEKKYGQALEGFIQACKLDRTLISDFRKASAAVRRNNEINWSEKYVSGLAQCGVH
jgi:tetratricopeptide (TPR) repeat protein